MRFLPYYRDDYTRGEIVPHNYVSPATDPVADELPLTWNAGMRLFQDVQNRNYPGAFVNFVTTPITMMGDMIGKGINQSINGYTRAYNNAATIYNNAAADFENWRARRNAPQTMLTGRKITDDMNPAPYLMTVAPVQKTVYMPVPAAQVKYGNSVNAPRYYKKAVEPAGYLRSYN